jgi:hypothetical protein
MRLLTGAPVGDMGDLDSVFKRGFIDGRLVGLSGNGEPAFPVRDGLAGSIPLQGEPVAFGNASHQPLGAGINAGKGAVLMVSDLDLAEVLLGRDHMARRAGDRHDLSGGCREAQDHAAGKNHVHEGGSTLEVGSKIFVEKPHTVVDLPGRADGRSIAASLVSFEIEMASGGALDGDAALVSREGSAPGHGVVVAHGKAAGSRGISGGRACRPDEPGGSRRRGSCRGGRVDAGVALAILLSLGIPRSGLCLDTVFVPFLIALTFTGAGFLFLVRLAGRRGKGT